MLKLFKCVVSVNHPDYTEGRTYELEAEPSQRHIVLLHPDILRVGGGPACALFLAPSSGEPRLLYED